MPAQSHYETLGLAPTATQAEIVAAYRRLAMRWHPDRNLSDSIEAETRFKEIQLAYSVLSDEQKKASYDAGVGSGSRWGEGTRSHTHADSRNWWENPAQTSPGWNPFPEKGEDIRLKVTISVEIAFEGGVANVKRPVLAECSACGGDGEAEEETTCPQCDGGGYVLSARRARMCPNCDGCGYVDYCPTCDGQGHVLSEETASIDFPPGLVDGSVLRVRGGGLPGEYGGANGDLLLSIKVSKAGPVKLTGLNLQKDIKVDFATAALGGTIEVAIFSSRLRVQIPAMSRAGKVLRLAGKGVRHAKTGEVGDLLLKIVIDLPRGKLSASQREMLASMFGGGLSVQD